jgi:hypothetical protein
MVRLHPDTPDDLEIPILTLCSVLDQVVDEVPEDQHGERERMEDLLHQPGVHIRPS